MKTLDQLRQAVWAAIQNDPRFQAPAGGDGCKPVAFWLRDVILDGTTPVAVILDDSQNQQLLKLPVTVDAAGTVTLSADAPTKTEMLYAKDGEALRAKYSAAEFDGEPPTEFMYMPGGQHTVWLSRAGKPAQVTVNVTPETAVVLQAKFAALQKERAPQRPYFDFEHKAEDASAWPVRFYWKDGVGASGSLARAKDGRAGGSSLPGTAGVYVEVEWSLAGKEAVVGKVHRAFSPVFFADADFSKAALAAKEVTIPAGHRGSASNPASVIGLDFCAGSLTNEPAFRKILPLWAKDADPNETGAQTPQPKKEIHMDPKTMAVDAAELEVLKAKAGKTDEMQKQLDALKAKEVDSALARAVERGAIEPKNEALKAKYAKIGDVELIDALPGKDTEALKARVTKPTVEIGKLGAGEALKHFREKRENCSLLARDTNAAKAASKEAGVLYAREIRPIIEGDGFLPLEATDTLVTDIVSQRVLDFLRYEFPLLSAISTNFSDDQLKLAQNVITRLITPPDVVSYSTSTGWPNSTTDSADISVPMSAQKAVQIRFSSASLSGTNRRLFDEQAAPAAYSIKKDCVDLVLALITTAFTNTAITKALGDWDRKGVIALKNGMKKAQIPMFNPFALLSIDYYDKLAEDGSIVSIALPESAQAMKTGILPRIHGLQPIEAQNEAWANNIVGFGGIPSALALATALPMDYTSVFPGVNAGGQGRVVTDAETGLSLMEVKFLDHQLADASMRLAYMRGAARGPVTHGVLLKKS